MKIILSRNLYIFKIFQITRKPHDVDVVRFATVGAGAAEGFHHAVPDQAGDHSQGGALLLQGQSCQNLPIFFLKAG